MSAAARPAGGFLEAFLAPLAPHLARADVTDIFVNRPGELWVETPAGLTRQEAPELTDAQLWWLARQIAAAADQGISREHPLLAATLPGGARVQVCAPPATRGHVALAIRRNVMPDLTLGALAESGAFAGTGRDSAAAEQEAALAAAHAAGDWAGFLALAVRARKTILIGGATATGKTTVLNALLKEVPGHERLILIEDTPEIVLGHENAVGLVAARGRLGEAEVSPIDLMEASLRLRPDRIIVGEVRGAEALAWARAAGSGHPGSISTVHASSAEGALEQLTLMAMQARTGFSRADLHALIAATVDVYVQLERRDGRRVVADIRHMPWRGGAPR